MNDVLGLNEIIYRFDQFCNKEKYESSIKNI